MAKKPTKIRGSRQIQEGSIDAKLLEDGAVAFTKTGLKIREVPVGLIDGTNNTFTPSNNYILGSEQVFVNGILKNEGVDNDYVADGIKIVFTSNAIPKSGDIVLISYWKNVVV